MPMTLSIDSAFCSKPLNGPFICAISVLAVYAVAVSIAEIAAAQALAWSES